MLVAAFALRFVEPSVQFYVSPKGRDEWVGSRSRPFLSLEKARDAIRSARIRRPNLSNPIFVNLEPGVYERDAAFQLTPEDSGTASSPTVYRGKNALISGGKILRGFTLQPNGWWKVNLPEVKSGKWSFEQLFVNGNRRYRPRLPKQGYFNIASEIPPTHGSVGHGFDRFGFRPGDIVDSWSNLHDVELLCFHIWDMSRMRIGSVDSAHSIVTTAGPTGFDADWAKFPKGNRFIVENVKEALSDPGEWYLDSKSGDLTYIPMKGESIENSTVVAPRIPRLLQIVGQPSERKYVEHLRFEEIRFETTNWTLPAQGRFFPQAEIDLDAAIQAKGFRESEFTNCEVSHVGEYGMAFGDGCQKVMVDHCRLFDLGAGGFKIGEGRLAENEESNAQGITIRNSTIRSGGRLHPAAIGVWIGQSSHNVVEGNEIRDLYYTGVSIGWTWGYSASQAHDNVIRRNEISEIGQGVLSDMGGIYTLGIQHGTQIVGNLIHDIDSFSYGGWGIYPDEGSSYELIDGNVVYRTKSGGFHQHYGRENVVTHNVFAFAREAEIIRTRAEDHLSFTFEHNIVYWKDAPLLGSNWSGNNYLLDDNLYWRTDGKPVDFAGMSIDQWHAKGQDLRSVISDPMFVDPSHGDFRLRADSPASKIGFDQTSPTLKRSKKPAALDPPAFPIPVHG